MNNKEKTYIRRVVDDELEFRLETFSAVLNKKSYKKSK